MDPIDVVVHPVERHRGNLGLVALHLPVEHLSSEGVGRTIPDAGADQVLIVRSGKVHLARGVVHHKVYWRPN